jgi:hypothetical protein
MAAQVNADTLALQLERVYPKLNLMYETDDVLTSKILRKGEKVSTRNARIILRLRPGGNFGLYNPDGGNMGRGTATKYEVAQVTPVHLKEGLEVNKLVEMATNESSKAVKNAFDEEIKNAMGELRTQIDKLANRASTGQLGTVASVASLVITLDADTSFPVSARFRVGSSVVVSDAGLTTNRGSMIVTSLSDAGPSITVDAVPGGTTGTDVLLLGGSTVAGGAVTSTALFGIPYHQNDATSGTWLGLTRSATTLPEIITPVVDAGGAALTTSFVRQALNKIRQALGVKTGVDGLLWYQNPVQTAAYEEIGIIISDIVKTPNANQEMDLFFGPKQMAGVEILESNNASRTRIDGLHIPSWGRVVTQEIGYFKIGDTKMFAPYTNGAPDAATLWYLTTSFQLFTENPRRGVYIKNLAIPVGY